MLQFLADRTGTPVFRHFALACCRRVAALLEGGPHKAALSRLESVAAAEEPATGDALEGARSAAAWAALAAGSSGPAAEACALAAVFAALLGEDSLVAQEAAWVRLSGLPDPPDSSRIAAERQAQADLLRELCDPFEGRRDRPQARGVG
jgi:hypothetical protein